MVHATTIATNGENRNWTEAAPHLAPVVLFHVLRVGGRGGDELMGAMDNVVQMIIVICCYLMFGGYYYKKRWQHPKKFLVIVSARTIKWYVHLQSPIYELVFQCCWDKIAILQLGGGGGS